jgi:CubicO group peptidase (beta-lactamase class C family)
VTAEFALLRSRMRQLVDQGKFAGIATLVWQDGEVIALDMVGQRDLSQHAPVQRDTLFRLASMTKPITSVAALILVDEGQLNLSDPITRWLPEAAGLRVLRTPASELDDVVPAERLPTLFDLMTHTAGFAWGKGLDLPITRATELATGQTPFVPYDPDCLVRRVCALPLLQQPGSGWHYSNSADLLGVIIARASNRSLPEFMNARIFAPLGMIDTGFYAPPEKLGRLSVGYGRDSEGRLAVHDDARTGFWSRPPIFPAGGGGLLSTLDDYLIFAQLLLNKGKVGRDRLLSEALMARMTSNVLPAETRQTLDPSVDFLQGQGYGLGVAVTLQSRPNRRSPGSVAWPGGYGTTWFADPQQNLIAVLMSQVWQESLTEIGPAFEDAVYVGSGDAAGRARAH